MDFERSYDSAIEFLYENKNKSMFRPKPYAVSYSIRSREFRVVGFYKEFTPTLNALDYKDPKCVIVPVKNKKDYRESYSYVIGGIGEKKSNNNTQYYQQYRIYDGRQTIAVCCSAQLPYGSNMYLFEDNKPKKKTVERRIVAMRGRNPNNPSERARSNGNYQQRFEFNSQGICNTLTTVDKDNYLLEITYG